MGLSRGGGAVTVCACGANQSSGYLLARTDCGGGRWERQRRRHCVSLQLPVIRYTTDSPSEYEWAVSRQTSSPSSSFTGLPACFPPLITPPGWTAPPTPKMRREGV